MLPDGFRWSSLCGVTGPGRDDALYCGIHQVARMDERVDGGWNARLFYPNGQESFRRCTSRDAGRAGCEAWAARHEQELRDWAELERLRHLARSRWAGKSSTEARRRLTEMGEAPP
jgi:hypothetical protein